MGSFSIAHWLIFLVVVALLFGTSKLKNAGKDLGSAVKGFKDAVREEDAQQNRVINHQTSVQSSQRSNQEKQNV